MLLAAPLYLTCLAVALAPIDLRSRAQPILYCWLALVGLCIFTYILFSAEILDRSDYGLYYRFYTHSEETFLHKPFEPLFSLIMHLLSASGIDFRLAVVLFSAFNLTCIFIFLKRTFSTGDVPMLLALYANFFLLYNLMFNILRHGLAASLVLVAVAQVLQKKYMSAAILILVSALLHRSSLACLLMFLPSASKRVTLPWLIILFVATFAGSVAGINEMFADNILSQVGFMVQKWELYYQNSVFQDRYPHINRLDFLAFSLVPPFIFYAMRYLTPSLIRGRQGVENYERALKIYMTLMMPFALFAFLPYSDRFAVYGWMMWPVVTAWPFLFISKTASVENFMSRLVFAVLLIGLPIIIQYRDNLFTLSVAVQDVILGAKL